MSIHLNGHIWRGEEPNLDSGFFANSYNLITGGHLTLVGCLGDARCDDLSAPLVFAAHPRLFSLDDDPESAWEMPPSPALENSAKAWHSPINIPTTARPVDVSRMQLDSSHQMLPLPSSASLRGLLVQSRRLVSLKSLREDGTIPVTPTKSGVPRRSVPVQLVTWDCIFTNDPMFLYQRQTTGDACAACYLPQPGVPSLAMRARGVWHLPCL